MYDYVDFWMSLLSFLFVALCCLSLFEAWIWFSLTLPLCIFLFWFPLDDIFQIFINYSTIYSAFVWFRKLFMGQWCLSVLHIKQLYNNNRSHILSHVPNSYVKCLFLWKSMYPKQNSGLRETVRLSSDLDLILKWYFIYCKYQFIPNF